MEILQANKQFLIQIQALWRGFKIRKVFKFYKSHNRNNKYFTYEEYKETINSNRKGYFRNQREFRKHTYRTGAIYEGDWKGGFRDG